MFKWQEEFIKDINEQSTYDLVDKMLSLSIYHMEWNDKDVWRVQKIANLIKKRVRLSKR